MSLFSFKEDTDDHASVDEVEEWTNGNGLSQNLLTQE